VRQQVCQVGDVALHWAEAGDGDALLLLHGGHGGWVHWAANIDELAAQYRVLAPDLPGFGESSDPGRCFTPQEHAQLLRDWLEQLGIAHLRLVGFSFGSLVALELTLAAPSSVDSLVLVNPPGVGPRSAQALALPERMSAVARQSGQRAGVAASLRELMLSRHELITDELVDRMALATQRTRHVTRSISRQSPTLSLLAGIDVPTAVLIGERDPFHSNDLPGRVKAIDGLLGAGATRIVPGAAHWLQYDQPGHFSRELRSFFHQRQDRQETT